MSQSIVSLNEEQLEDTVALLARAFHQDPFWLYVVPDPVERARAQVEVFRLFVRFGHFIDGLYSDDQNLLGVAVWISPRPRPATSSNKRQYSGWQELPSILGAEAFGRLSAVLGYEREVHNRALPEPHWYLMQLGVEPPSQGKGIGGQLVQSGIERARSEGMSSYLETEQPRNVKFYLKQGFTLIMEAIEPSSGLHVWTFRHDP